ncbi:hypothetical protein KO527_22355 [Pseudoalteromonas sp. C2R02]|uniref:hypothetical protein n=1 Tax=Pseudoalteromonas sp. C2R02 TaxID=2841565 RepID=UPI001C08C544|nr:hypothetical protein [Pseudoalteromonas sp. C2R02]MBU2972084.1 hypothetical protein [Pseudoalteromonas sp. C2R02]
MLKIEQSRAQYIFNKVYTEFIGIIIALIAINAVSFYNHESFSFEFIYYAIFVTVIISTWLAIFNSGKGKIVENGITIDESSINYIRFYKKETIKLAEYNGYSISGRLLRQIKIKNKSGASIVFDYYTFSPKQRKMLFSCLASVKT